MSKLDGEVTEVSLLPASPGRWKGVRCFLLVLFVSVAMGSGHLAVADTGAVLVEVRADDEALLVGEMTRLRVFGEVSADVAGGVERIFSWYLDCRNGAPSVVGFEWATLSMATSDNIPQTSGDGVSDGAVRRGIYNTFLRRAGAGVGAEIELFSVDVRALSAGVAEVVVEPGSGVANLAEDFIVAPSGGGEALTGGDYSNSSVLLRVSVPDTEDPVISGLPGDVATFSDPGSEGARVVWGDPTASDNVGVVSFVSSHRPGDLFPIGTTTVRYTATDGSGNVNVAEFTVRVVDLDDFGAGTSDFRGTPVANGDYEVRFNVVPGYEYVVQANESLAPGGWFDLPGARHLEGLVVDMGGAAVRRFYRLRVVPMVGD